MLGPRVQQELLLLGLGVQHENSHVGPRGPTGEFLEHVRIPLLGPGAQHENFVCQEISWSKPVCMNYMLSTLLVYYTACGAIFRLPVNSGQMNKHM